MTPRQQHNRKRESLASRVERIRRERGLVDLFEPPTPAEVAVAGTGMMPPHQPQSPTSVAAAESVRHKSGTRMAAVQAFIERQGGATDYEIRSALSTLDFGTESLDTTLEAARCKLRDEGVIRDSGRTRRNPSGREAVVWEMNPEGTVKPKREPRAKLEARAAKGDQVIANLRAAIERAEQAHAGDPVSVTTHSLKAILRGDWR